MLDFGNALTYNQNAMEKETHAEAKPVAPNKCYVIFYVGVFDKGYVRSAFIAKRKKKNIRFEAEQHASDSATKYRFRWYADFWCWMYNMFDKHNRGFRIYTVREYPRHRG